MITRSPNQVSKRKGRDSFQNILQAIMNGMSNSLKTKIGKHILICYIKGFKTPQLAHLNHRHHHHLYHLKII